MQAPCRHCSCGAQGRADLAFCVDDSLLAVAATRHDAEGEARHAVRFRHPLPVRPTARNLRPSTSQTTINMAHHDPNHDEPPNARTQTRKSVTNLHSAQAEFEGGPQVLRRLRKIELGPAVILTQAPDTNTSPSAKQDTG
eukprot:2705696-Rhodomonas_salina.4